MKLYLMTLALIVINILYWTFSEKYIHNGSAANGAAYGISASIVFIFIGVMLGLLVNRINR